MVTIAVCFCTNYQSLPRSIFVYWSPVSVFLWTAEFKDTVISTRCYTMLKSGQVYWILWQKNKKRGNKQRMIRCKKERMSNLNLMIFVRPYTCVLNKNPRLFYLLCVCMYCMYVYSIQYMNCMYLILWYSVKINRKEKTIFSSLAVEQRERKIWFLAFLYFHTAVTQSFLNLLLIFISLLLLSLTLSANNDIINLRGLLLFFCARVSLSDLKLLLGMLFFSFYSI